MQVTSTRNLLSPFGLLGYLGVGVFLPPGHCRTSLPAAVYAALGGAL